MPPYHSAADLFGAGSVYVESAPTQPSGPPWSSKADPVNDNEAFFTSLAVSSSSATSVLAAPSSSALAPLDPFSSYSLAPAVNPDALSTQAPAASTDPSSHNTSRTNSPSSSPLATTNASTAPSTSPSSPTKTTDLAANVVSSVLATLSLSPAAHPIAAQHAEDDNNSAIPFASSQEDNSVSSLFASSSADLFGRDSSDPSDFFYHQQQQQQAQPADNVFAQHATSYFQQHEEKQQEQQQQQQQPQQYPDSFSDPTLFSTEITSTAHATTSVTAPAPIPTPAPQTNDHAFFESLSQGQQTLAHYQPHQPEQAAAAVSWTNDQFANSTTEFSNFNNQHQTSSQQAHGVQQQQQQQQPYFEPYQSGLGSSIPTAPSRSPAAVGTKIPSPPSPPPPLAQQHNPQPQHVYLQQQPTAQHASAPMSSTPSSSTSSAKRSAARHRYPTFDQQVFPVPQPSQQPLMNPYDQVSSTEPAPSSAWQQQQQGYQDNTTSYQHQQPYGGAYSSVPLYPSSSNQSGASPSVSADPFLSMTAGQSFFARVGSSVTSTLAYTSTKASKGIVSASSKIAGLWQGHQHSQQQGLHSHNHQGGHYAYGQQQQQQLMNETLNPVSTRATSISTSSPYAMVPQQEHTPGLDPSSQQSASPAGYACYPYGGSSSEHHQQQQHHRTNGSANHSGFSVASLSSAAAKAGAYLPSLPSLSHVPLLNKLSKQGPQLPSMYHASSTSLSSSSSGHYAGSSTESVDGSTYMSWPSAGPGHASTRNQQQHQQSSYQGYDSYGHATYGGLSTTTAVAGELWNGLRHEVQKGRRLVETGVQAGVAWWCNNRDPKIPV
ncbi:hypothetical protein BGW42_006740 [Actinomortierella wolfii]|nr:hypothetical protein BGW42_006740 [Actinomortierella wolfii]